MESTSALEVRVRALEDKADRLLLTMGQLMTAVRHVSEAVGSRETYTLAEAANVVGYSERHLRRHPELLPPPVSEKPRRYRVQDVHDWLAGGYARGA